MEGSKNVVIIGIGNCGSQVAYLAEKKYPNLFDCIYINTSDSDLSMVTNTNGLKFKIGKKKSEKDEVVEGSGKNRRKMKEYLKRDINDLLGDDNIVKMIQKKKYAYVIASAAGGTGSGAAPVLFTLARKVFPLVNFKFVGILPKLSGTSPMELGNTTEYLHELYDLLPDDTSYMIYDNDTVSDLPETVALTTVNENIVEDLRVLTGIDNFATPYSSIDGADLESIWTTPGRTIVVRVTKGLTEKNLEDHSLDDIIIKTLKQSCHTETDRNKKVVRWGVITYFTEPVNKLYRSNLEGVADFIGEPLERFNHNAINKSKEELNFLYLIAAGLSPINDRAQKIADRIAEIEEMKKQISGDAYKYVMSGDESSYSVTEERNRQAKRDSMDDEVDPDAIFDKFM